MLVNLLVTFIALKIKTPSLPEDSPQDLDSMETWICLGIALFTLTMNYLRVYLEFDRLPLALTLFIQSFFHGIVKVGFLAFFVYKTPNLHNFVINYFRLNVENPFFNELTTTLTSFFVSLKPAKSNKIDVIVWKINSLIRVGSIV